MGRSRGGLTTKIHALADALGRPLRFILTAGEAHDVTTVPDLLAGLPAGGVIADKAYDTNAVRELIAEAKKQRWDIDPLSGEEMEKLAKEVMTQPKEVIEKMKWVLGN